jgi:tagatose 6-phosphate kinase
VILAVGLSPVWQQIVVFDAVTSGAVNRAKQAQWCASGKVLNVGIALHHLGSPSRTLTALGGWTGDEIRREFASRKIDARWITTEGRTRVCTTIIDHNRSETTELVENCLPISEHELAEFQRAYVEEAKTADTVVFTGSIPESAPRTVFRNLLAETSSRVILDVRGQELMAALEKRPFLVKPNRDELSQTCGYSLDAHDELIRAMRDLNQRGAEWVVVTAGGDDVYATCHNDIYRFTPVATDVVNPIGCGDCLAAGIAAATSRGSSPVAAIRFGIAAAANNLSQLLPALLDVAAIDALQQQVAVRTEIL